MKKIIISCGIIFTLFSANSKDIRCKIIDTNDGFIGSIAFRIDENKKNFILLGLAGSNQILADENYGIIYQFKNNPLLFKLKKASNFKYYHKSQIFLNLHILFVFLRHPSISIILILCFSFFLLTHYNINYLI